MSGEKKLEAKTVETYLTKENALDSFKQGIVLQEGRGYVLAVDPTAAEILGLTAEQLIGTSSIDPSWQTIHEDGSPFEGETHPAMVALSTGKPCIDVIMGFYRPSGELVWLKLDSQPLFRASEEAPYAVITTIAEITAHLNEQNRLPTLASSAPDKSLPTEQATNLRLFVQSAPVCLAMFDRNMHYIALSQKWVDIYQLDSVEASVGRSHYEIFTQIPDRWRQAHQQGLAGEIVKCEKDIFTLADGSLQWLRWEINPWYTDRGEVGGIVIFVEDIGDRLQIEETVRQQLAEMESIYTNAPIGLCFVDTNFRFVRINEQLAQINGLPVSAHIGRTLRDVLPEMAEQLEPLYQQVIESGKPIIDLEVRGTNRAQPGRERDWLVSYYPQKDSDDLVVGVNVMVQEITERKRAEISLRSANQRIITIWESMTDAYVTLDREWRIAYANPAAEKVISQLTNLEPKSFLGRSHWELFPFSIGREIDREYRRAVSEQVAVHLEIMYEPTDNWFEIHAYPSAEGLGIYFRDISDRKQAEVALRESERKYRTVFETIDEGFCVCEMLFDDSGKPIDYRFLEVNPAFEKMTGLEQATGKTARELIPNLETSWFDLYGRVALTGEPIRFENRSIAMNRWFDVNAFRVGEPQSHKFGVLFTNITDRKSAEIKLRASEERLSLAIEASGMATWDIDLKTDKAIWSERYFSILGYEFCLGGETTFNMWKNRLHPEDLPRVMQIMERAKQERSLYNPEYRIIRADNGEIVWLRSFGRFFYDEVGEAVRFSGIVFNNTDRKRFETEREQLLKREQAAREEAERANRVKDEFLAILSHELRSPLNPILGWTQLLKTYKSDPKRLDQGLDTIDRNAKLLLELIDDLLDVAKVLRGKIALNLAPVNLVRAIEGALETVSAAASAKSIAIETDLNSIGQVNGDLARLQQVFWNLLSNAVKFTNNGGKIEVKLLRVGDAAQITVNDNGKGIAPEFLPHVFEYFRQADSSITRKHGGLGLGLALVRHLVELHGGVVSVTSPGLGGGATFIVNLPLLKTKSDSDYSDGSNLELSKSQPDLTGVRILVVDDDPDNLEFLTMALQCYQASVVAVTSGYEALAIFEEFAPNILVSDIAMPEMDGLTLIKSIRSRTPETKNTIPAIAISAYARESDREKAIAAGFQIHIPKPIDINVLAATILELLQN
ncbi:MAG: PAS domain-containing protein [Xenococcaceae cyanobacterium]